MTANPPEPAFRERSLAAARDRSLARNRRCLLHSCRTLSLHLEPGRDSVAAQAQPRTWQLLLRRWPPDAHLLFRGGSPAVVVEAGLGSDWLGWQGIQPQLSTMTRFCTYDRSGLGWSEPRAGKRDAEAIVRQLHSLLDQAGVAPPFVFVGHSAGGMYAREYAREFPADLAGVVLVDSASPQQFDELPGFRASYDEDKRNAYSDLRWEELRVFSGWERLTGHCRAKVHKDVAFMAGQYNAQQCRPEYEGGDLGEFMDLEDAARQAARTTSFGKIPLLILTKDTGRVEQDMSPNAVAGLPVWEREQEGLKSLSPASWRVVARGAGHQIYHDRPDVVVAEISRLILYLRGGPTPPFGTTAIKQPERTSAAQRTKNCRRATSRRPSDRSLQAVSVPSWPWKLRIRFSIFSRHRERHRVQTR